MLPNSQSALQPGLGKEAAPRLGDEERGADGLERGLRLLLHSGAHVIESQQPLAYHFSVKKQVVTVTPSQEQHLKPARK